MKHTISRFTIILILLIFLQITLIPSALCNIIPVKTEGGSPTIDTDTDLLFFEEIITYVIDKPVYANVTAVYYFKNPTNQSIQQELYLPYKEMIYNLSIHVNKKSIQARKTGTLSYYLEGVLLQWMKFEVTFPEYNITRINVTYRTLVGRDYTKNSFPLSLFTNIYQVGYISETGSTWGNPINATFIFKIKRDLYLLGLNNFEITWDNKYVVASTIFTDWMPDRNIEAEWHQFQFKFETLLLVLVSIIIITLVLLTMRARTRKRIKNK
jgi:hypothetical protein